MGHGTGFNFKDIYIFQHIFWSFYFCIAVRIVNYARKMLKYSNHGHLGMWKCILMRLFSKQSENQLHFLENVQTKLLMPWHFFCILYFWFIFIFLKIFTFWRPELSKVKKWKQNFHNWSIHWNGLSSKLMKIGALLIQIYAWVRYSKFITENERLQTRSNFDQKDHDLLRLNANRKSSSFCIHGGSVLHIFNPNLVKITWDAILGVELVNPIPPNRM